MGFYSISSNENQNWNGLTICLWLSENIQQSKFHEWMQTKRTIYRPIYLKFAPLQIEVETVLGSYKILLFSGEQFQQASSK